LRFAIASSYVRGGLFIVMNGDRRQSLIQSHNENRPPPPPPKSQLSKLFNILPNFLKNFTQKFGWVTIVGPTEKFSRLSAQLFYLF